jgi:hypothetical protein
MVNSRMARELAMTMTFNFVDIVKILSWSSGSTSGQDLTPDYKWFDAKFCKQASPR